MASVLEGFGHTCFYVGIKPKGFRVIEFDGFITKATINQTREALADPELSEKMMEHNYRVEKRYYSYSVLEPHLQTLIADCFGEDNAN